MSRGRLESTVLIVACAAVYVAAAKLGLSMAGAAAQVTPVWPPTGLALAAVILLGRRVWPGIFLGAFIANATTDEPLITAAAIAAGNTLEALAGAWLVRRAAGLSGPLTRVRHVVGLITVAAVGSTAISATIGSLSLCVTGVQPWGLFTSIWRVWFLGDAVSDLVVAPLVLTWAAPGALAAVRARAAEAAALLIGLAVVCAAVFLAFNAHRGLAYLVFPFIIWAGLRHALPVTALAASIASAVAIVGSVTGSGMFSGGDPSRGLMMLQLFMAIVAITGLLLAASTAERDRLDASVHRSQRRLRRLADTLEQRVTERTALAERRAAEVRDLAGRLSRAEQAERRRLAHRLHDDLQQLLVASRLHLQSLAHKPEARGVLGPLARVESLIDETITISRTLTAELSPPVLHEAGLGEALQWLARWVEGSHNLVVRVEADADAEPDSHDVRVLLFHGVRELLFNVTKHAGVDRATVRLTRAGGRAQIVVRDDGAGFTVGSDAAAHEGFGLASIRQRLEWIDGGMHVDSAPGRGTTVTLHAPLHSPPTPGVAAAPPAVIEPPIENPPKAISHDVKG